MNFNPLIFIKKISGKNTNNSAFDFKAVVIIKLAFCKGEGSDAGI